MSAKDPEMPGSAKDDRLAMALARGMTQAAAARLVGLNERTVRRKLEGREFKSLVAELRSRMVSEAVGLLAADSAPAVKRLRRLVRSKDESIQLQAIKLVVQALVKLGSFADLNDRMTELEARLVEREGVEG